MKEKKERIDKFTDFIDNFDGELVVSNNKVYHNSILIAVFTNDNVVIKVQIKSISMRKIIGCFNEIAYFYVQKYRKVQTKYRDFLGVMF